MSDEAPVCPLRYTRTIIIQKDTEDIFGYSMSILVCELPVVRQVIAARSLHL
jgi:hypothetical protein